MIRGKANVPSIKANTLKSERLMSSVRHRLLGLAVVAAWFLCPLPQPSAIKTVDVERAGPPSSTVVEERFVCVRRSDEILLRANPKLSEGRVQIDLLDPNGTVVAGPFVLTGDKGNRMTFVTDDGFPRGLSFCLRCTEVGALGRYRLSISQPWTILLGQRYLAALAILTAGLVVTVILGFLDIGGDKMHRLGVRFGWYLFLATFWLLYPVVHEVGHMLALMAFDAWGTSGTLVVLPLDGQLPHVAGKPSADLAPWQIAVAAIAGPLLPTLLGYASFALWISPYGRRWRANHLLIDVGWSMLTVMLVFPIVVMWVPMLFPHTFPERDCSLFLDNVGVPLWGVNSAVVVVALINLAIVVWMMKHLVPRIRAVRKANRAVQRTEATRFPKGVNPTSGAADSSR
jgi:hypothetical protein